MDNKGTIYTYSVIYTASEDFKDQTPYVIALIDSNDGRSLSRLENYTGQEISIGQEVEFSRIDEKGIKIYKF